MPRAKTANVSALREFALSLTGVEESIACAGTTLEKRAMKVRKKTFLFLGESDLMLKLAASLPAANKLTAEVPDHFKVGARGWTTVKYGAQEALPNRARANEPEGAR